MSRLLKRLLNVFISYYKAIKENFSFDKRLEKQMNSRESNPEFSPNSTLLAKVKLIQVMNRAKAFGTLFVSHSSHLSLASKRKEWKNKCDFLQSYYVYRYRVLRTLLCICRAYGSIRIV